MISELTRTYQTTNPCQRALAARKTISSIYMGFEAVANHAHVDALDNSGAREWVPLEYLGQNPYKNATTIIAWGTFWMRAAAMGISPLPEFFAPNTIFMPPLDDILSLLLSMKAILVDNLSVIGQTRPVWSMGGQLGWEDAGTFAPISSPSCCGSSSKETVIKKLSSRTV